MKIIFAMTWKEMLRKKVLKLTLLMTVVFLAAFWFVAKSIGGALMPDTVHTGNVQDLIRSYQAGSVILTLGFFFGTFVVAFLSIFSSVSVIAGETEQGELQALLSRPISRGEFYMGRWFGFVSLGIAYAACLFLAILGITAAHATVPGDWWTWTKGFALFAFIVPLLVSVSMLGSGYFTAMGNGVMMTMLYGAGWLGGMIGKFNSFGLFDKAKETLDIISGLMDLIMPADALSRRMMAELLSFTELKQLVNINSMLGPFGFPQVPSNLFLLYSLFYTLAAFYLGMRKFKHKDL